MKPDASESKALEALLLLYDNGWGETFASIAMRAQGVTNVNAIPTDRAKLTSPARPSGQAHLGSVMWYCPRCGTYQAFSMEHSGWDAVRSVNSTTSRCAECECTVYFWAMIQGGAVAHLSMHPPARRERVPVRDTHLFPERIQRLYEQAFRCFMTGDWDACIAMCRKLVEGALKEATGTEGVEMKTNVRIEIFTGDGGWAETLKRKLQVVSGAGNLGAHFDMIEPTYPMATKVMDITENILSLVYAWPATVDELDELLKNAREAQAGQSAEGE